MFLILYFLGYIDPILDIERKSNAVLTSRKGLFIAEKDLPCSFASTSLVFAISLQFLLFVLLLLRVMLLLLLLWLCMMVMVVM